MECPNHQVHILLVSGKYKSSNVTGLYPLYLALAMFAGNVLSSRHCCRNEEYINEQNGLYFSKRDPELAINMK